MSEHNHEHHISTAGQLWAVGIAPFDIVFALSIALIKAFLVAAFFMNLYWDVKFNTMLLIGAATFFILMFSVTLLDTMFRVDVVPGF